MEITYYRLHCTNCKLVWGKDSTSRLKSCPICGRKLALKQYTPWIKVAGGLLAIAIGAFTIFVEAVPIIWIGGVLFGLSLIGYGLHEWSTIKDLDYPASSKEDKTAKYRNEEKYTTITCGNCGGQVRVPRGKGIFTLKCDSCSREARVMT